MRWSPALLAVVSLLLGGCNELMGGASDEDITRLACIKVLRWNHDPGARDEIYRDTLDLYTDAQNGEVAGEQTWENLVRMFTNNDLSALANWESSEACQQVDQEVRDEYDL